MAKAPSSPISLAIASIIALPMPLNSAWLTNHSRASGVRVGVVADDVDALRQRLLEDRRDRHRIVGGEQDAVDAAGDVIVDELDLLVDLGLGRAVGLHLDVAEFLGRVLHALRGGVEIADADQLRHVDDGDRLARFVRRVGRLAAVVGLGRSGGRDGSRFARERAGRQIVAAVPLARGVRAGRPAARANRRTAVVRRYFTFIVASFPASPPGAANPLISQSFRRCSELAISIERISTTPMTTIVASPLTPVSARPFFSS